MGAQCICVLSLSVVAFPMARPAAGNPVGLRQCSMTMSCNAVARISPSSGSLSPSPVDRRPSGKCLGGYEMIAFSCVDHVAIASLTIGHAGHPKCCPGGHTGVPADWPRTGILGLEAQSSVGSSSNHSGCCPTRPSASWLPNCFRGASSPPLSHAHPGTSEHRLPSGRRLYS